MSQYKLMCSFFWGGGTLVSQHKQRSEKVALHLLHQNFQKLHHPALFYSWKHLQRELPSFVFRKLGTIVVTVVCVVFLVKVNATHTRPISGEEGQRRRVCVGGDAASSSYKNIGPGGCAAALTGCWGEQLGAEPCMKPPYCLELPVLPERRGPPLFTRSHLHCIFTSRFSMRSRQCGFLKTVSAPLFPR